MEIDLEVQLWVNSLAARSIALRSKRVAVLFLLVQDAVRDGRFTVKKVARVCNLTGILTKFYCANHMTEESLDRCSRGGRKFELLQKDGQTLPWVFVLFSVGHSVVLISLAFLIHHSDSLCLAQVSRARFTW